MTDTKEKISIEEIRNGLSPLFKDEGLRLVLLFGSAVSGKIHKKATLTLHFSLTNRLIFWLLPTGLSGFSMPIMLMWLT